MADGCVLRKLGWIGLTLSMAGCASAPSGTFRVIAVDDSVRVMADAEPVVDPDLFDEQAGRVSIASAINEVVAFQLVFQAGRSATGDVRIRVDDFVSDDGRISSAQSVRLYREHVIPISRYPSWFLQYSGELRAPREYPDALIPLSTSGEGSGFSLTPGRNHPIWVDVQVPAGTRPGVYRSMMHVTGGSGFSTRQVAVHLTVWPFALSDVPASKVLVGIDHETLFAHHLFQDGRPVVPRRLAPEEPGNEAASLLLDATIQLLHEHKVSPFLVRFFPVAKITGDATVEVEWEDYDRVLTDYLDGTAFADRVRLHAWPLPIDRTVPVRLDRRGGYSLTHAAHFAAYLKACAAHFREKGWYDRHFVWYEPIERNGSADSVDRVVTPPAAVREFAQLVESAEPDARWLMPYPPQDMRGYGWDGPAVPSIAEHAAIVCPSARWYAPSAMREQREAGRTTWVVPDQPPYSGTPAIEADWPAIRSLPWLAEHLGAQALLLPTVNDWPDDVLDLRITRDDQSSDRWLIYPGPLAGIDVPVPSIRLKQIRRGVQDLAYLELLRLRGHDDVAKLVADALYKRGGTEVYGDHFFDTGEIGWARRTEVWRLARRLMADVLARQRSGRDERGILDAHVRWTRFLNLTQSVGVDVKGVRIKVVDDGRYEVTVHVDVVNDRRDVLHGRLRFDDLPLGWTPTVPAETGWVLGDLAPGRFRRMTLTARADAFSADIHGITRLKIRFDAPDAEVIEVPVRLANLAVRRISSPLTVDGDLTDWPPGLGNVAGDFQRVGDVDRNGSSSSARNLVMPTTVFVCRDDERLYFGMRCAADPTGPLQSRNNLVRYDRTRPVGEDLVEIVLDPSNGGTGSTGDLYHLVIKTNGAVVSERGIGWHPPTGPRRVWSADVRVAVSPVRDGVWLIEGSVPFAAFDAEALRRGVWGVDFARLQPRLGAYTCWSGARWHLYRPRGLGNMNMAW